MANIGHIQSICVVFTASVDSAHIVSGEMRIGRFQTNVQGILEDGSQIPLGDGLLRDSTIFNQAQFTHDIIQLLSEVAIHTKS